MQEVSGSIPLGSTNSAPTSGAGFSPKRIAELVEPSGQARRASAT
jgi:hypothetical protein